MHQCIMISVFVFSLLFFSPSTGVYILSCVVASLSAADCSMDPVPISELNEHITCKLCAGYLIDATMVTECLHTCKS